jgi:hypothetical protein
MTQPQTAVKTRWTQAELVAEARARFGDDTKTWAFECPTCGDVATAQDFIDADADPQRVGQECIGRSLGALTRSKRGKDAAGRGCDWTAYGLVRGPWIIVLPAEDGAPEREVGGFALAAATVTDVAS